MASVATIGKNNRRRLVLTKLALAVFLLGMLVAGRSSVLWPVINWSMYHIRYFDYPAATTAATELVAITTG